MPQKSKSVHPITTDYYQEYLPKTSNEHELVREYLNKQSIYFEESSWNIFYVYFDCLKSKRNFEKYMKEYGYDYKFWRISN